MTSDEIAYIDGTNNSQSPEITKKSRPVINYEHYETPIKNIKLNLASCSMNKYRIVSARNDIAWYNEKMVIIKEDNLEYFI